ncbi:MAG TPA: hypothetical protein VI795_03810 [Patescibacteria group bacterium]|nr:hypothetical protein [Patescibacteria group bacterium]
MTEQETLRDDLIQMDNWFSEMDRNHSVGEIDGLVLDRVLDHLGATLEIDRQEEASLKRYSNAASRKGMNAVWKEKRYDSFVSFCRDWIKNYEDKEGNKTLPKLTKSGRKNAGMKEFFHQFTAFTYGVLSEEEFKRFTEVRLNNGKLWQDGKKEQREKVKTPISEGKKVLIGSIPPGFVVDFWKWLKTSVNE